MKRLILALWLLLICSIVKADDGAIRGIGGTVSPMKQHPTVRMVREKVDIKLHRDGAVVRCRFVFRNEGPAAIVKMGFPEQAIGDIGSIKKSAYRYFRSWVDGKKANVRFVPSAKSDSTVYRAWHVKDVPFSANQTRIIEDEYSSEYGGDTSDNKWFSYILCSGRNWKGNIGEAVIAVDGSEIWSYRYPKPDNVYPHYIRKDKNIVWNLRNLEPDKDITINLNQRWKIMWSVSGTDMPFYIDDEKLFGKRGIAMVSGCEVRSSLNATMVGAKMSRGTKFSYGSHNLVLRPGSRTALLDGKSKVTLPHEPYIMNGSLSIPILTVAKLLGLEIVKDKPNGKIYILDPAQKSENLKRSLTENWNIKP